jgi:hypothetical protein
MDTEIVCWLRKASFCNPPLFEANLDSAEACKLANELNVIMRRSGSAICSFPASLLCCGLFCSSIRNSAALRQVDLLLQQVGGLQLTFRRIDVSVGPDCWVEKLSVGNNDNPVLYQHGAP